MLCQFERVIYPRDTRNIGEDSFMIVSYKPCEVIKDSSGNRIAHRVKINYLSDISKQTETLSLDELIDKGFQAEDPQNAYRFVDSDNSFSFNDDAIAEAVMKLPKKRRRILELLFIEGLKPIEVSELLGCSLQHVYNRRSAAIKELRSALIEEAKK